MRRAQGGGQNDAAVIGVVERYAYLPPIPGALANGEAWFRYLRETRGVRRDRVTLLRNEEVTREALEEKALEAAGEVGKGGTSWWVFIGHGAASADGKEGVLIGADAQQTAKSLYARSVARRPRQRATGRCAVKRRVMRCRSSPPGESSREADGTPSRPAGRGGSRRRRWRWRLGPADRPCESAGGALVPEVGLWWRSGGRDRWRLGGPPRWAQIRLRCSCLAAPSTDETAAPLPRLC